MSSKPVLTKRQKFECRKEETRRIVPPLQNKHRNETRPYNQNKSYSNYNFHVNYINLNINVFSIRRSCKRNEIFLTILKVAFQRLRRTNFGIRKNHSYRRLRQIHHGKGDIKLHPPLPESVTRSRFYLSVLNPIINNPYISHDLDEPPLYNETSSQEIVISRIRSFLLKLSGARNVIRQLAWNQPVPILLNISVNTFYYLFK